jgi:DNA-binding CsgD family transcriptional regulator
MPKRTDTLAIVEAAYRPADSPDAWASGIASALSQTIGGAPCAALLYDATNPRWVNLDWTWTSGIPAEAARAAFDLPMPDNDGSRMVNLYRSMTFTTVRKSFPAAVPQIGSLLDHFGYDDFALVNATDPTFRGLLLAFPGRADELRPRTRHLWRQVGAHLAAGLRLQRSLVGVKRGEGEVDAAEAVLSPTGEVEHAIGEAKTGESRRELQEALIRIAAARDIRDEEPFRAAELWTGLCAGRWSFVEHFESDSRRYFLAYRNDPRLAATRALSERERQVLTYAAMGHSNKLIAYSLGLALSTVAAHLDRARRKIGHALGPDALQALASLADERDPERDPMD